MFSMQNQPCHKEALDTPDIISIGMADLPCGGYLNKIMHLEKYYKR